MTEQNLKAGIDDEGISRQKLRILIVTQNFFPHGDATSAVVANLGEALIAEGCQIDVIAIAKYIEDIGEKQWKKLYVKQLRVDESIARSQVKGLLEIDKWNACKIISKKIINKIRLKSYKYKWAGMDPAQIRAYSNELKNLLIRKQYDICIVTLAPIDAVQAFFSEVRHIPIVVYQLDTFWNNDILPSKYQRKRLQFETQIIRKSAFILTTSIIAQTNQIKIPDQAEKIIATEFPMIKEDTELLCNNTDICHCVFTGIFYSDIRPPEKVIRIIAGLQIDSIVFDFYGEKQELILDAPDYENAKDRISLEGLVSSEEALQARKTADILINIDNTTLSQVPSKIFEYISLGKPIINFYFNANSPTLIYLEKYPLCLNILLDDDQKNENIRAIEAFVAQNKGKRIPYGQIQKIYNQNTPEYVAKQFLEAFQHFKEN